MLAASILADMSDLMSSIFHSRMLQPLIPLVVNFFNYKHFPDILRILLYNTQLLVPSLLEFLLSRLCLHTGWNPAAPQSICVQLHCHQHCLLHHLRLFLQEFHSVLIKWSLAIKQGILNQKSSFLLNIIYLFVFLLILQLSHQSPLHIARHFNILNGSRPCKLKWMLFMPITHRLWFLVNQI